MADPLIDLRGWFWVTLEPVVYPATEDEPATSSWDIQSVELVAMAGSEVAESLVEGDRVTTGHTIRLTVRADSVAEAIPAALDLAGRPEDAITA